MKRDGVKKKHRKQESTKGKNEDRQGNGKGSKERRKKMKESEKEKGERGKRNKERRRDRKQERVKTKILRPFHHTYRLWPCCQFVLHAPVCTTVLSSGVPSLCRALDLI
jgi:hypothetical protein